MKFLDRIIKIIGIKDLYKQIYPHIKLSFLFGFRNGEIEVLGGYGESKPDPEVLQAIKDRVIVLSESSAEKLHGDLRYQILEGIQNKESITEIKQRIKTIYDGKDHEVERIARTETIRAQKAGTEESYKQAGVWGKQWLAAMGNKRTCDRCKALNGQIVPVGENFINPSDGSEVIGNMCHPNCRCSIISVFKDPNKSD